MKKNFFITTTLPYVNADPHIGFALEIVQADVIARYQAALGKKVFFNTGTDEHGLKIFRKAKELGQDIQTYTDECATKWRELKKTLNLSYTHFIRTTDPEHIKAAQEFWKRCDKKGDIYKKLYEIKYCVGCELEKTESELVNNRCPIHPNLAVEIIKEENYFFRFSKYQKRLSDLYKQYPNFVMPQSRLKEIKSFVGQGLQDFSISRLKEKMPWGVPVPGDDKHVMYVWFDALINYISTLGWPKNKNNFEKFWGTSKNPNALQVAGKDNLRQQSAMWQAQLMSASLPSSRQIFIHGFITANGQKMSKSLGNVVSPLELVAKYGTDPVRYFLLREMSPSEDGDFTYEKFEQRYNADLAKGLGNLTSRIIALYKKSAQNLTAKAAAKNQKLAAAIRKAAKQRNAALASFKFNEALAAIWELISFCDKYIEQEKPWEGGKEKVVHDLVIALKSTAVLVAPFLPETSEKILAQIKSKKNGSLFPRL